MLEDQLGRIFSTQWHVFLTVGIVFLGLAELGRRFGMARRKVDAEASRSGGTLSGAVLGLLALMLGFSFAMALSRHETRRSLVVEEANAIGTTFLRADLLPEPHVGAVQKLLREYVRLRLDGFRYADDPEKFSSLVARCEDVHRALWHEATAAAKVQSNALTSSFISSLNATIDLHAERLAESRNRVPGVVWLLLLCVGGCGVCAVGHECGTSGRGRLFSRFVFPLLIAVVTTIIADVANPRRGLIGVSQQPLVELQSL